MNNPSILVTGGAGYIGSHTAEWLRRAGYSVIAADSMERGCKIVGDQALAHCDFRDFKQTLDLLTAYEVDAVIHFAAYAYVGESIEIPDKYYENNIVSTLNLLKAAKARGVAAFLLSSSCAIYGEPGVGEALTESVLPNPINPYGRTKLACEWAVGDYCGRWNIPYGALRYFNVAGCNEEWGLFENHSPETHLIPNVLEAAIHGTPVRVFGADFDTADGTAVRDYVHVMDLAEAHGRALEKLCSGSSLGAINIGRGRGASILEVIKESERVTGRTVDYEFAAKRTGDPAYLVSDVHKAKSELGFVARHAKLDSILHSAYVGVQLKAHGRS